MERDEMRMAVIVLLILTIVLLVLINALGNIFRADTLERGLAGSALFILLLLLIYGEHKKKKKEKGDK